MADPTHEQGSSYPKKKTLAVDVLFFFFGALTVETCVFSEGASKGGGGTKGKMRRGWKGEGEDTGVEGWRVG